MKAWLPGVGRYHDLLLCPWGLLGQAQGLPWGQGEHLRTMWQVTRDKVARWQGDKMKRWQGDKDDEVAKWQDEKVGRWQGRQGDKVTREKVNKWGQGEQRHLFLLFLYLLSVYRLLVLNCQIYLADCLVQIWLAASEIRVYRSPWIPHILQEANVKSWWLVISTSKQSVTCQMSCKCCVQICSYSWGKKTVHFSESGGAVFVQAQSPNTSLDR